MLKLSSTAGKLGAALFLLVFFLSNEALRVVANPTGGQVVSGSASINTLPGTVTINQTTGNAIINWQDFSIASGELTRFVVPTSSSATLNRVVGGNLSTIYGTLQSNGQVYLLNPNGILIGASGEINTAGFIGSTLNISNDQFNQRGDLNFSGTSDAAINNQGTIHAATGDVYLIAAQVNNGGSITATQGTAGLAAGTQVFLQKAGDQHLFVNTSPNSASPKVTGVSNTGTISSAAAELKAAGGNAYALAINNSGNIVATGIKKINGQVYLTADGSDITNSGTISAKNANGNGGTIVLNAHSATSTTKGTLLNSGAVTASGTAHGTKGGTVELLGDKVGVTDNGVVDVSGDAGGGTALIGGDEHGANAAIPDADQTYVGPDAMIAADALTLGNGGKVIVWSNSSTQAYGAISVRGGSQNGNGGFVETSGALLQTGIIPDRSAPHGKDGTWLLDPTNITITDTGTSTLTSPFNITAGPYTINQADLLTALQGGSVTLDASNGSGGAGNITWQQPGHLAFNISSLTNSPTLELDAPGALTFSAITINQAGTSGSLNLTLNSTIGTAGNVTISNSALILNGGSFTANGNGYVSASTTGNLNGVYINGSTVSADGGINITGNAGYDNPGSGLTAGIGVLVSNASDIETSGGGNITISGTFNQNITSTTSIGGFSMYGAGNLITADTGTISITGTVLNGTADGTAVGAASVSGIEIGGGAQVTSTGSNGSIMLTGDASGGSSVVSGTNFSFSSGIEIGGNSGSSSIVSVVDGGQITLQGTGGSINASAYTGTGSNHPFSVGTQVDNAAQITGGNNASITIEGYENSGTTGTNAGLTGGRINQGAEVELTGSGGSITLLGDNTGSTVYSIGSNDSYIQGFQIGGDTSATTTVSANDGATISITGTGGAVDTSNAGTPSDILSVPGSVGVDVDINSHISGTVDTSVTINGTGGDISPGTGVIGSSFGVVIYSDTTGSPTTVSTGAGSLGITGTAGSSPNQGIGTLIGGFGGGTATVTSSTGDITINGTGGSGSTGVGNFNGFYLPNDGILIVDHATVSLTGSSSGTMTLTGGAGSTGSGVDVVKLSTTLDPEATLPVIDGGANGGVYLVGSTESDAINVTGMISGYDVNMNSGSINLTGTTVTTTDPTPGGGLNLGDGFNNGNTGEINITNSTLTGSYMQLGYDYQNNPGFGSLSNSQVSIDNSAIHLVLGTNPSGTGLQLFVIGSAATSSSPGVSITNGSVISADDGGEVVVQGTGLVASGSNAIGVVISDSTMTYGTSSNPGAGQGIDIEGQSDQGYTTLTPDPLGTTAAIGVEINNGSAITLYSNSNVSSSSHSELDIHGTAFANNSVQAIGVDVGSIGTANLQVFDGHLEVHGTVKAESVNGSTDANTESAFGTILDNAQLTESGPDDRESTLISLQGEVKQHVTSTDGGNASVAPESVGISIGGNSEIAVTGNTTLTSIAISVLGSAGQTQTSSGNTNTAIATGIEIDGNSNSSLSTLSTDDLGAITLLGDGGTATGPATVADGVDIQGVASTQQVISATAGGSIGISGLGGVIDPTANSDDGARGVMINTATVTTSGGGGLIAIGGAAGANSGVTSNEVVGLELVSAKLETNTTIPGGDQNVVPNGGPTVPPMILLYTTSSSGTDHGGVTTFTLGSATDYAIKEDSSSAVITQNLVMGNYYDLFTAFAPSGTTSPASTFVTTFLNQYNITLNPAGIMDLSSPLNQITNLDSVMVGSGGLNFNDSVNLTVDPIGASDGANYGQVDMVASAPVFIETAGNLTLTTVSPITQTASSSPTIGSAIATTGAGNDITLVVGGKFINQAGAAALSTANGSSYIVYVDKPADATLDGLVPVQTLYSTAYMSGAGSPTSNSFAYASAQVGGPDTLSGTAFTDNGMTETASGTTIDLDFDGSQIGTTTTNGSGAFTFTISSADLTSGVLLVDATDKGNTYYQANSPLGAITNVDLWGSTLRILADVASNTALKQAAGNLAMAGINYSLTGSNLTTNAGVNMAILSSTAYTLDGDINVSGTLTTSASSQLTSSLGNVNLTGTSMALGGSLASTGTVNFNATGMIADTGSVQVGGFILQNGTWSQIVGQNGLGALPAFSDLGDFELQNSSTFERFAGGNGSTTPYMITDVFGLQGLASPSGALLGANADLANDINAIGTSNWNSGAGFVPIGNATTGYTGTFDGQGHAINGLYMSGPANAEVGLFGEIDSGAMVQNVGVTNVQAILTGAGGAVGGLVGFSFHGTINNSYSTGSVSGTAFEGGLVGGNSAGTINNSYSTCSVTGTDSGSAVGGLVGYNIGAITYSHSSGPVRVGNGNTGVGGLVGSDDSSLTNFGTISYSYSTGSVTAGANSTDVGGLLGISYTGDSINNAYSSGSVNVGDNSTNVGGLLGLNSSATVSDAFSTGNVTVGLTGSNIGGLVGYSTTGSTITNTYTISAINSGTGSTDVGGLVGNNDPGTITTSFWDTDTAGNGVISGVGSDTIPNTTPGVLAANTSDLESQSYILENAPTWDFTNTWTTYGGTNTPQVIGLPETTLPQSYNDTSLLQPVNDSLFAIEPIYPVVVIPASKVVGGASGVATKEDQRGGRTLQLRLAQIYGRARADRMLEIIENDLKDGSTVNTGSLTEKWAANTGMSKLVLVNESAQLFEGLAFPSPDVSQLFNKFQGESNQEILDELSQAAFNSGSGTAHDH